MDERTTEQAKKALVLQRIGIPPIDVLMKLELSSLESIVDSWMILDDMEKKVKVEIDRRRSSWTANKWQLALDERNVGFGALSGKSIILSFFVIDNIEKRLTILEKTVEAIARKSHFDISELKTEVTNLHETLKNPMIEEVHKFLNQVLEAQRKGLERMKEYDV